MDSVYNRQKSVEEGVVDSPRGSLAETSPCRARSLGGSADLDFFMKRIRDRSESPEDSVESTENMVVQSLRRLSVSTTGGIRFALRVCLGQSKHSRNWRILFIVIIAICSIHRHHLAHTSQVDNIATGQHVHEHHKFITWRASAPAPPDSVLSPPVTLMHGIVVEVEAEVDRFLDIVDEVEEEVEEVFEEVEDTVEDAVTDVEQIISVFSGEVDTDEEDDLDEDDDAGTPKVQDEAKGEAEGEGTGEIEEVVAVDVEAVANKTHKQRPKTEREKRQQAERRQQNALLEEETKKVLNNVKLHPKKFVYADKNLISEVGTRNKWERLGKFWVHVALEHMDDADAESEVLDSGMKSFAKWEMEQLENGDGRMINPVVARAMKQQSLKEKQAQKDKERMLQETEELRLKMEQARRKYDEKWAADVIASHHDPESTRMKRWKRDQEKAWSHDKSNASPDWLKWQKSISTFNKKMADDEKFWAEMEKEKAKQASKQHSIYHAVTIK